MIEVHLEDAELRDLYLYIKVSYFPLEEDLVLLRKGMTTKRKRISKAYYLAQHEVEQDRAEILSYEQRSSYGRSLNDIVRNVRHHCYECLNCFEKYERYVWNGAEMKERARRWLHLIDLNYPIKPSKRVRNNVMSLDVLGLLQ